LSEHNVSVGIVSKGLNFRLLNNDELRASIAEISDAMDVSE